MADYGVKPEGWGHLVPPARAILKAFWERHDPQVICGWTEKENRAALAFARRLGFKKVGDLPLADGGVVVTQEWRR